MRSTGGGPAARRGKEHARPRRGPSRGMSQNTQVSGKKGAQSLLLQEKVAEAERGRMRPLGGRATPCRFAAFPLLKEGVNGSADKVPLL